MPMDMNSAEYLTLIEHTEDAELVLKRELGTITSQCVAKGLLIRSSDEYDEICNQYNPKGQRARKLFDCILNKVIEDKDNYSKFIDVLKLDLAQRGRLIETLNKTYRVKKGGDKKKERIASDSAEKDSIQETPSQEISYPDVANYDRQTVEQFLPGIKVILHVVNDKERAAIVHRLGDPGPINMFSERNKIILGTFGGYKVAVVQTEMGEACRNELVIALHKLPDVKVILAIGVCWGIPKYDFGDVLVSTIIHSLGNIRLSDEGMIPRANELDSTKLTDNLTNIFVREAGSWNQTFQCSKEGRCSQVITGEMISGPFLIDSIHARDDLINKYPEKKTIGGEMEGYVAVQIIKSPEFAERKIGVIIIKAVVDYADKDKPGGKKWQFTGAAAAADFAYCKLQATDGKAFDSQTAEVMTATDRVQ